MVYDVFISYRRIDGFGIASLVRECLQKKGIRCFMDVNESRPGNFAEHFLSVIETVPNFVLILTRGALDHCDHEHDWIRVEVEAAIKAGCKIIPIKDETFVFPDMAGYPASIATLATTQCVTFSREYYETSMLDRLLEFLTRTEEQKPDPKLYAKDFFSVVRNHPLRRVDMAFHAGADWFRTDAKADFLAQCIRDNITVRVMSNSAEAVERVCKLMQHPLRRYAGFETCARDWTDLSKRYPNIMFRVCESPLLHRIYLSENMDGSGLVALKYYTYGNDGSEKDPRMGFDSTQPEYALYKQEFECLWERVSHPYEG